MRDWGYARVQPSQEFRGSSLVQARWLCRVSEMSRLSDAGARDSTRQASFGARASGR